MYLHDCEYAVNYKKFKGHLLYVSANGFWIFCPLCHYLGRRLFCVPIMCFLSTLLTANIIEHR